MSKHSRNLELSLTRNTEPKSPGWWVYKATFCSFILLPFFTQFLYNTVYAILIHRALGLRNASLEEVMLCLERAVRSGPEELGLRNIMTQPHAWSGLEQQLQSIDVSVEPV
jgi:hypothetical protein